jgi:hypothetical protein
MALKTVVRADLAVAWQRLGDDYGKRGFTTHPHFRQWVEQDLDGWLGSVEADLLAGYFPKPAVPCYVPKPGSMVRPASVLDPRDELVYAYLVGQMYPCIWKSLSSSQGDPDVAYQLTAPATPSPRPWVHGGVRAFTEMRNKSVAKLTSAISHVVVTDITGYYENIDIQRVTYDLRSIGVDADCLDLLADCLRRWSAPRGKGIPQGLTASDILAKVYFAPIDRALQHDRIQHLRYVDDLRLFCRSKRAARRAVVRLTELVSQRGLNLQTAKTEILPKTEAKQQFEGVAQKIADVTRQLVREVLEDEGEGYVSPLELFNELSKRDKALPAPDVLMRTFDEEFPASGALKFNKSLFHFLLRRLGAVRSGHAVHFCLDILVDKPDETADILAYFRAVGLTSAQRARLVNTLVSADVIYDHQRFELLRWFYADGGCDSQVLDACRTWAFDMNRSPWLRSYAMAILGLHGDHSDLERIEQNYARAAAELERGDHVAALSRMEVGRRNAIYNKLTTDGDLVQRAVRYAKAKP